MFGVLTITMALLAQAQAQSFLTNGLVAYYPFNGNANDASGNGNNGVLGPGIGFGTDRFGTPNHSLFFTNGVAGQMTTTLLQPAGNVFTLTAWFNLPISYTNVPTNQTSASTPWRAIIGLTETQSGQYARFDKMLVVGPYQGATTNDLTFYLYPGYSLYLPTPVTVADGHWHQVVATLSSLGMMLYLDGNLAATNANTSWSGIFGYWRIYPGQGFVDDVRIYNLALSSSQVQQLYAYEAPACLPHAATATATVVNGFVVGATITDGGCGYTNAPLVLIQGGGGTGATASAVVKNGVVTGITITGTGSGYTGTPAIYIYSPLGWQVGIMKSVTPTFSDLLIGTNYQLQVSSDMNTWANQGSAFTATNPVMVYPQPFGVPDWNQLFFRLELAP